MTVSACASSDAFTLTLWISVCDVARPSTKPALSHCSTPPRMKPSRAVSHPADTRHRALGGPMVPAILSERSAKRIRHF
jgi:hypothetical protein